MATTAVFFDSNNYTRSDCCHILHPRIARISLFVQSWSSLRWWQRLYVGRAVDHCHWGSWACAAPPWHAPGGGVAGGHLATCTTSTSAQEPPSSSKAGTFWGSSSHPHGKNLAFPFVVLGPYFGCWGSLLGPYFTKSLVRISKLVGSEALTTLYYLSLSRYSRITFLILVENDIIGV